MSKQARRIVGEVLERLREYEWPAKADEPPVSRLKSLVQEIGDVGAALAEIAGRAATPGLREQAVVLLYVACKSPVVPPSVGRQLSASARPVLLAALRDPQLPDETKYVVGPIYHACGGKLGPEAYRACFADFEATANRVSVELARKVEDSMEGVERCLEAWGLIRHDAPTEPRPEAFQAAVESGMLFARVNPSVGVGVLATTVAIAIEHDDTGAVEQYGHDAVEAIAAVRSGRSLWFLRALGHLPVQSPAVERAAALAGALEAEGLEPEPPRAGTFSHGLASGVDGAGDRNVALFFRTDAGDLDALVLLMNERIGFKDVWAIFGNAADMDEEIRARSGDAVTYAPCSIELARRLVADALAKHAAIGVPAPGRLLLYSAFLGPEPIEARRHTPDLGAYALETYVRGPTLVEGSEDLFESALYRGFWFSSDAAYDFVAKPRRRRITPANIDGAVDEFLMSVVDAEKDLLAGRMAASLEIEALGGRASVPANRMAARVWLALTENVVPFHEIPIVRCLAAAALRVIRENLGRGHRNQREANKASLEIQDPLADLADMLDR